MEETRTKLEEMTEFTEKDGFFEKEEKSSGDVSGRRRNQRYFWERMTKWVKRNGGGAATSPPACSPTGVKW